MEYFWDMLFRKSNVEESGWNKGICLNEIKNTYETIPLKAYIKHYSWAQRSEAGPHGYQYCRPWQHWLFLLCDWDPWGPQCLLLFRTGGHAPKVTGTRQVEIGEIGQFHDIWGSLILKCELCWFPELRGLIGLQLPMCRPTSQYSLSQLPVFPLQQLPNQLQL